jgi:hypothetical protein
MKHHNHCIGWREANNLLPGSARREWLAIAIANVAVVVFVVIVVRMLAR